jgi:hypothetical protein
VMPAKSAAAMSTLIVFMGGVEFDFARARIVRLSARHTPAVWISLRNIFLQESRGIFRYPVYNPSQSL